MSCSSVFRKRARLDSTETQSLPAPDIEKSSLAGTSSTYNAADEMDDRLSIASEPPGIGAEHINDENVDQSMHDDETAKASGSATNLRIDLNVDTGWLLGLTDRSGGETGHKLFTRIILFLSG